MENNFEGSIYDNLDSNISKIDTRILLSEVWVIGDKPFFFLTKDNLVVNISSVSDFQRRTGHRFANVSALEVAEISGDSMDMSMLMKGDYATLDLTLSYKSGKLRRVSLNSILISDQSFRFIRNLEEALDVHNLSKLLRHNEPATESQGNTSEVKKQSVNASVSKSNIDINESSNGEKVVKTVLSEVKSALKYFLWF